MTTNRVVKRFASLIRVALLLSVTLQMAVSDAAAGSVDSSLSPSAVGRPHPADSQPQVVPPRLELVGQFGGSLTAFIVSGEFAYAGVGPRMKIIDISDAANPTSAGETDVLPAMLVDLVAAGRYAYVAMRDHGVRVFDVTDPTVPVEVGSFFEADLKIRAMAIEGDTIYMTHDAGLTILDVSNPFAPVALSTIPFPASDGGQELAVADGVVYVAAYQDGIRMIDVSDPYAPVEVGSIETASPVQDLTVTAPLIYAVTANSLVIIDVTVLTAPVQLSSYPVSDPPEYTPYRLAARNGYLVVTARNGFLLFDVANPALPVQVSITSLLQDPMDVAVDDRSIYAAGEYGFQLFLPPQPTSPSAAGSLTSASATDSSAVLHASSYRPASRQVRSLALADSRTFPAAASGLFMSDLSTLITPPVEVGRMILPLGRVTDITVAGDLVYTVGDASFLSIVDVTDLATPTQISSVDKPYLGWTRDSDVEVANGFAYVLDNGSLHIFSITNPALPVEITHTLSLPYVTDVAIAGRYAYAAGDYGLNSIDIQDPEHPRVADDIPVAWTADEFLSRTVALSGHYAYVGGAFNHWRTRISGNLVTVDIADPAHLGVAGSTDLGAVWGVAVDDSYAYATASRAYYQHYNRLFTVDVSNPLLPTPLAWSDVPYRSDIVVAQQRAYLTSSDGLTIFDIRHPLAPVPLLTESPIGWPTRTAVDSGYLYVATEAAGFYIYRYVERPTLPQAWLPLVVRH